MMLIGETLATGTLGLVVYSPWFEACGNAATFAIEVLSVSSADAGGGAGQMVVQVQTKGLEDKDASAITLDPGNWTLTVAGVESMRFSDFKDLVRFKYILSVVAPSKDYRIHYRMLPPMWEGNRLCCSVETELSKDVDTSF